MLSKKEVLKGLIGKKVHLVPTQMGRILSVGADSGNKDSHYKIIEVGDDVIKCEEYNGYNGKTRHGRFVSIDSLIDIITE